jgi:hypothetical protein
MKPKKNTSKTKKTIYNNNTNNPTYIRVCRVERAFR